MAAVTRTFILKNISSKTVNALGMRIKPGKTVNLFDTIVGLHEGRIYDAMSAPDGELYKKIYVFRELELKSSTLYSTEKTVEQYRLKNVRTDLDTNVESTEQLDIRTETISATEASNTVSSSGSLAAANNAILAMQSAMAGNMYLYSDGYEFDISASELNNAEAGDFTKNAIVMLTSSPTGTTRIHNWANFEPVVNISATISDGDIDDPTAEDSVDSSGNIVFRKGVARMTIEFDTDAGATKTYQAGDSVDVTIKVASDDKLLGYTVSSLTLTYTVI